MYYVAMIKSNVDVDIDTSHYRFLVVIWNYYNLLETTVQTNKSLIFIDFIACI